MTVSCLTITKEFRMLGASRYRLAKMSRSKLLKTNRFDAFRCSTLSWWRSVRISVSSEARDRKSPGHQRQEKALRDALIEEMRQRPLIVCGYSGARSLAVGAEAPSLLSGLIVDSDGNWMTPTHAVKNGKRYRHYVSMTLITVSCPNHPKGRRIPAGDIEGLVLDRLRLFFRRPPTSPMLSHYSILMPIHSMRLCAMQAHFQSAGSQCRR
jgi:hypothetical protein